MQSAAILPFGMFDSSSTVSSAITQAARLATPCMTVGGTWRPQSVNATTETIAMTDAIAHSNNAYFASLGEKLGFERVSYYARLFGLGEKAGLDIDAEQPGILPPETPKSGMGMMTSFGDGISLMFWIQGTDSARCCEFRGGAYSEARYFGDGAGIAVKKGNTRLREVLDYVLARVKASGRYEELMLRYFPLPLY